MGPVTGPSLRWASMMALYFSLFIKLRLISVLEDTTTNEKKRRAAAFFFCLIVCGLQSLGSENKGTFD